MGLPGGAVVENLPASAGGVSFDSLGREDPLEWEVATYSSILGWKILWPEEPGELHTAHGAAESDTTE